MITEMREGSDPSPPVLWDAIQQVASEVPGVADVGNQIVSEGTVVAKGLGINISANLLRTIEVVGSQILAFLGIRSMYRGYYQSIDTKLSLETRERGVEHIKIGGAATVSSVIHLASKVASDVLAFGLGRVANGFAGITALYGIYLASRGIQRSKELLAGLDGEPQGVVQKLLTMDARDFQRRSTAYAYEYLKEETKKGFDETKAKEIINVVRKETCKKIKVYQAVILAALLSLVGLVLGDIFSFGILPYVLYSTSGAIGLTLGTLSWFRKSHKPPVMA